MVSRDAGFLHSPSQSLSFDSGHRKCEDKSDERRYGSLKHHLVPFFLKLELETRITIALRGRNGSTVDVDSHAQSRMQCSFPRDMV